MGTCLFPKGDITKRIPLEVIARDTQGKVDVGIHQYIEIKEMMPRPSGRDSVKTRFPA
jgi:hypothetical protein